jgi:phenylpropionate dioxygenase-like ring-hydroxylating dioxygenase large terminal subunit
MTPATIEAPRPDLGRLVDHLQSRQTDMMESVLEVDPAVYTDPEIARLERERVFGRVPFAVAHVSELEEPGSFITNRLPNNEAIIVRQTDGTLRAMLNVCRHRGSMVEDRDSGTCNKFQCPYHGWSYNLDGSLKSATHEASFGDFDHLKRGLIQLPIEERHGFVWVVDSPEAKIDVAGWLGPEMDSILASYGIENRVCVHSGSFDEPSNWKVLQDAFLDGYHIQFVHKDTAAKMTYTNILTIEDYGRHSRFFSPRTSIQKVLGSNGDQLSDEQIRPHINISHGLLPNATMLFLPDHIQLLSFFPHPSDPGRSRMEIRLIPPRVEDTELEPDRWQSLWDRNWQINMDILRDEDFPIAHRTQRAVSSTGAAPMIFGRNEVANQVFHRELAKLISEDTE